MKFENFNDFIHFLRTQELKQIPQGFSVFLSAGCSGRWYFDWINENYPGIKKHIGVEAYSPKPVDLPPEVIWSKDLLSEMKSVGDNSIEIAFAGQTIEHLWPEQFSGFLKEIHRVLKPNGWFILDSPNRRITKGTNWYQPQHTMELTVKEIVRTLRLAGFGNIHVKGMWLTWDYTKRTFLPLFPDSLEINITDDPRIKNAFNHPEDSFIWWADAQKLHSFKPKIKIVDHYLKSILKEYSSWATQRVFTNSGVLSEFHNIPVITCDENKDGCLRYGPYIPLQPGKYKLVFEIIGLSEGNISDDFAANVPVIKIDVSSNMGEKILQENYFCASDLTVCSPRKLIDNQIPLKQKLISFSSVHTKNTPSLTAFFPNMKKQELFFSLDTVEFGVEFRVYVFGRLSIMMNSNVHIQNL